MEIVWLVVGAAVAVAIFVIESERLNGKRDLFKRKPRKVEMEEAPSAGDSSASL